MTADNQVTDSLKSACLNEHWLKVVTGLKATDERFKRNKLFSRTFGAYASKQACCNQRASKILDHRAMAWCFCTDNLIVTSDAVSACGNRDNNMVGYLASRREGQEQSWHLLPLKYVSYCLDNKFGPILELIEFSNFYENFSSFPNRDELETLFGYTFKLQVYRGACSASAISSDARQGSTNGKQVLPKDIWHFRQSVLRQIWENYGKHFILHVSLPLTVEFASDQINDVLALKNGVNKNKAVFLCDEMLSSLPKVWLDGFLRYRYVPLFQKQFTFGGRKKMLISVYSTFEFSYAQFFTPHFSKEA